MNNPNEIRDLAIQRLNEAKILAEHEMWDGAFYLAGYSVELALKAKICENFGVPNLFEIKTREEKQKSKDKGVEGVGDVKAAVQKHDLHTLLIYSCLKNRLESDKLHNKNLETAVSLVFSNWNENVRYKPCGHAKTFVKKLITLLADENGLLSWIKNN